jgi:hypothetical protein
VAKERERTIDVVLTVDVTTLKGVGTWMYQKGELRPSVLFFIKELNEWDPKKNPVATSAPKRGYSFQKIRHEAEGLSHDIPL